jgi:hypothetical protein
MRPLSFPPRSLCTQYCHSLRAPTHSLTHSLTHSFSLFFSSFLSQGTRISFIAFTHGLYNKVDPYVKKQLLSYGFTAARTDGKDIPFFEAFRIEKSYLSDKVSE